MTDRKPDWADEIAKNLWNLSGVYVSAEKRPVISAALRKAKADGIRECSSLMKKLSGGADVMIDVVQLALIFDEAADKIEKGED